MMYQTIITFKSDLSNEVLLRMRQTANGAAFCNRAGCLLGNENSPHELVFASDDSGYACLELGTLALREKKEFIDCVTSWKWVDEDPDESCDMLEVFARHK